MNIFLYVVTEKGHALEICVYLYYKNQQGFSSALQPLIQHNTNLVWDHTQVLYLSEVLYQVEHRVQFMYMLTD